MTRGSSDGVERGDDFGFFLFGGGGSAVKIGNHLPDRLHHRVRPAPDNRPTLQNVRFELLVDQLKRALPIVHGLRGAAASGLLRLPFPGPPRPARVLEEPLPRATATGLDDQPAAATVAEDVGGLQRARRSNAFASG